MLSSWCVPLSKNIHAVFYLPFCVELRILDGEDVDLRKGMTDQCAEMLGKGAEGVVAALE